MEAENSENKFEGASQGEVSNSRLGCEHYARKCSFISPCCNKEYTCRVCHDDKENHTINRREVKQIKCLRCQLIQKVQAECDRCRTVFGKYFCETCRLYDDEDKGQFHCVPCGLCRLCIQYNDSIMTSLSRGKLALKESIKTSAKHKRRSPASWAEFWCKAGLDQEGLIKRVVSKRVGYGVFTTKKFLKGEFLLEYMGERINSQEANKREKLGNSYLFGFAFNGKTQWVGGREKFFHCTKCDMCLSVLLENKHQCVVESSRRNCAVCLEDLHTSRISAHIPSCGHLIHGECYRQCISTGNYACPTCNKSLIDMKDVWKHLDTEVENTPMPDEYKDYKVFVLCRDCHKESKVLFHVVGLKCAHCGSYNTCRASEQEEGDSGASNNDEITARSHGIEDEGASGDNQENLSN